MTLMTISACGHLPEVIRAKRTSVGDAARIGSLMWDVSLYLIQPIPSD